MAEQNNKHKLLYWFIGLFTGGAVAVPVTAFVCKNIYDKKMEEAVAKAADEGETRGMNAMAEYAVQQQQKEAPSVEVDEDTYQDPREMDITIDEEEEALNEEAHQRYMDIVDKYTGDDELRPFIIDEDRYINEQYMKKSSVNWYEDDDVFEEELDVIQDPYFTFGVTTGRDLFADTSGRPDPDICYVRNERSLIDFEINRIHGSYARMVGGEVGLGETDT